MRLRNLTSAALGLALLLAASTPTWALTQLDAGVFKLDALDDLLQLRGESAVSVLLIEEKVDPKLISDVHIRLVREWVQGGGVLWLAEEGLESPLATPLASFIVNEFEYKKSATGKQGGELIVRGVSPRHVIGDSDLTLGVEQLYLYPRYRFDGTEDVTPLVTLTDTEGNHGMVLAALPVESGLIVLDGTARKKKGFVGRMFGKGLAGFNPEHPNSLKQGKDWNNYDWKKIWLNAAHHAETAFAAGGEGDSRANLK